MEPTWENQLTEARKLTSKDLQRHAAVSLDNRHRCESCFCCAAAAVLEERKTYNVFHRTWWRRTASGREPGAGRKTYMRRGVCYADARAICKEYNDTHEPGFLSRKAEFEEA